MKRSTMQPREWGTLVPSIPPEPPDVAILEKAGPGNLYEIAIQKIKGEGDFTGFLRIDIDGSSTYFWLDALNIGKTLFVSALPIEEAEPLTENPTIFDLPFQNSITITASVGTEAGAGAELKYYIDYGLEV